MSNLRISNLLSRNVQERPALHAAFPPRPLMTPADMEAEHARISTTAPGMVNQHSGMFLHLHAQHTYLRSRTEYMGNKFHIQDLDKLSIMRLKFFKFCPEEYQKEFIDGSCKQIEEAQMEMIETWRSHLPGIDQARLPLDDWKIYN